MPEGEEGGQELESIEEKGSGWRFRGEKHKGLVVPKEVYKQ